MAEMAMFELIKEEEENMFEVQEEDLRLLFAIAKEIEKKSERRWHVRPLNTTGLYYEQRTILKAANFHDFGTKFAKND